MKFKAKKKWMILLFSLIFTSFAGYKVYRHYNPPVEGCFDREDYKEFTKANFEIITASITEGDVGNGRCLLILPSQNPSLSEKRFTYLKAAVLKGSKNKIKDVRYVSIRNNQLHDIDAMDKTISAADFNRVISENSDCDIIFSEAHLPFGESELFKIKFFNEDKPSFKFCIINGHIGIVEPLIRSGHIHSMTILKPSPVLVETAPDDSQEAFDQRYLLVNQNNLDSIKNKYPYLFPKKAGKKNE